MPTLHTLSDSIAIYLCRSLSLLALLIVVYVIQTEVNNCFLLAQVMQGYTIDCQYN